MYIAYGFSADGDSRADDIDVYVLGAFSAENDWEAERRVREQKIEQLRRDIQAIEAQQTTTQHDTDQFHHNVTTAREQLYALRYIHL